MIIKLNEAINEDQVMKDAAGYKELSKLCDKYGYSIDIAANYILHTGDTTTEVTLNLKDKNKDRFAPVYFAYDSKSEKWECGLTIDADNLDKQDLDEYFEYAELASDFMTELEKFDLASLALINTEEL